MIQFLRLFRCAIVLFILDGSIVNFRMYSSAMSKAEKSFEGNQVVPDVVPKAPNFIANIQYPSGVFVNEGAVLTPTQVKDPPRVKWDAEPNHFYTLAMTDADVPSRIDPNIHQWHHWLVVNIPGANVGGGDELYDYVGAGPPPETGLHRYVFLVYKQPGKLTFDEPILTNATLVNRGKFYIDDFAKKHHLGDPVAGNFFQAEYDDYVPELYSQLKKKYNL